MGILLAEQWIDKVLSVVRVNHQIMTLRLLVGKITLSISCVYAPQCGRPCDKKEDFYSVLISSISTISSDDLLIVCGDLNSHIGKDSDGSKSIHGGYGCAIRNADSTRILDMCTATNLVAVNSFFKNGISKLNTFSSGGSKMQTDYKLTRHANLKHTENIKVICGEECAPQNRLLVGDFKLCTKLKSAKSHIPKRQI